METLKNLDSTKSVDRKTIKIDALAEAVKNTVVTIADLDALTKRLKKADLKLARIRKEREWNPQRILSWQANI